MNFLKQNHDPDAGILVVGHGAMSKAFDWVLSGCGKGDVFGSRRLENAEMWEYEI